MKVHSTLNPMMQTTIGLSRFSSFLSLRMQCAHRQSRGLFMGSNVGLKVGKKRWANILGFVERIAKKTTEQPTVNQIIMKNINTLTPCNKVLPPTKGNESNLPFYSLFFFFHYFLFFWFLFFFSFFLLFFFFTK